METKPFLMHSPDVIILAAGDFPTHKLPLKALSLNANRIVCCDSAADTLLAAGYNPIAVVGDGDSIDAQTRLKLNDRFILNSNQDTNDLTKAVDYCLLMDWHRILILGATGKREDHTLGNIGLLTDYANNAEVEIWTDYGAFTPSTGTTQFDSFCGQQISIFCIDPLPITFEGLKYPLENAVISRWWQGTLNEAISTSFRIITNGRTTVFRKYSY